MMMEGRDEGAPEEIGGGKGKGKRVVVTREEARMFMLGHLALKSNVFTPGPPGVEEILKRLRCIQVDSLDPMGYSHELVVMARTDGIVRGKMFHHLPEGSYFEHWAKERCILQASAFPFYSNNTQKKMKHWWHKADRENKLAKLVLSKGARKVNIIRDEEEEEEEEEEEAEAKEEKEEEDDDDDDDEEEADDQTRLQRAIDKVLMEVSKKGPQVNPRKLKEIGKVEPHNWSGWKGTKSATMLALEILWGECRVVITRGLGRDSKEKLYSTPEAIFPDEIVSALGKPISEDEFAKWAVVDRVEAAGLLPRSSGPHWSVLEGFRNSPAVEELIEAGDIEEVQIEGSRSLYLAPKGWRERKYPDFDDRMRIIAPLDPILWNRPLVQHIFGFEYMWEVYKKEEKRLWGWYVCPLLHKGRFVGRMEGKIEGDALVIKNVWKEDLKKKKMKKKDEEALEDDLFDEDAFRAMLKRHAEACGVSKVIVNGQEVEDGVPIIYSSKGKTSSSSSSSTPSSTRRKRSAKKNEDEEEEEEDEEDEEEIRPKKRQTKRKAESRPAARRSTRTSARKRKSIEDEHDEDEEDDEEEEEEESEYEEEEKSAKRGKGKPRASPSKRRKGTR